MISFASLKLTKKRSVESLNSIKRRLSIDKTKHFVKRKSVDMGRRLSQTRVAQAFKFN